MEEILFIILIPIMVDGDEIYLTNPPQIKQVFDHYKAELFFSKDSLDKFLDHNDRNGYIIIDVKNGKQLIIKQQPVIKEINKIEKVIEHYETKW